MSDVPPPPPPPQDPYQQPQNPYQQPQQLSPADEKLWSTLVHVGGIFFYFVPALIAYLLLKDKGPFVRAHTATALNFQITIAIALVVSYALIAVFIGILLVLAVEVVKIVFCIIAAVKANQGQPYTYPLAIKFVS
ncbi:DUF4870 domain-containing protein [Agromyces sp. SYSU K20354]|uniref:DUF4870 domain-containing protein n=1 Tax=Agromyces cavernae TaxID=2898659 RepID=UPI001E31F0FD|nr:DUF4870 domain-containing protein [Agromyces cavernae]MCD2441968.1 DUF4870 domain-containing protein [Agromyces cavernae]